jgi:prepilin-type N-terminal cleavage/methylation domain-containing protein
MGIAPILSRSRRVGFTLIEVLVTLAILSTGIVLILSALSASTTALDESRDAFRMQALTRELLDQTATALAQVGGVLPQASGQYRPPNAAYKWTLDVAAVPGAGAGSQALCRVSAVVWRDGTTRRCAVETYVFGQWSGP